MDSDAEDPGWRCVSSSWVQQVQQGSFFDSVRAQRASIRSASATLPSSASAQPAATKRVVATRPSSMGYTSTRCQRPAPAAEILLSDSALMVEAKRPQTAGAKLANTCGQEACATVLPQPSPRAKKAGGFLPALDDKSGKSLERAVRAIRTTTSVTLRGSARSHIC